MGENKKCCGVDVARSLQGYDALITGAATYCNNFIYSYYPHDVFVPVIFWRQIEHVKNIEVTSIE
jgi:hypothetical protein